MPKYKRYKKKRKFKKTLKGRVYKNRKDIKLLKKSIEYKYFDVTQGAADCNTSGTAFELNAMQQGDTVSTRTGNRVLARRLTIRGYFNNSHNTPQDCIVRMIILKARDQNNASQTVSIVLNTTPYVNSHLKDEHKHRFQILADKTFTMDTSQHTLIPFYFTQKLNSVCTYNGNAGDYSDIEDGCYYIMFMSSVAGTTDDPLCTFISRFYYLDA